MHDTKTPEWTDRTRLSEFMSVDELSELGTGDIAYIKQIKARDLKEMFPDVPPLHDNMTLYALLNADGTPILLADSREAAIANAFEADLEMASLH
ncbi:DUF1150 domain-containing protein [Roseibium salinum]|uniref:DUF1150 domain-containing protein n=1 Tax=Roseibium salinum TaxID=1604349 RepID=A0ABT3R588_9HYPH|nr:DUF1150 domain-containing protein [Roseibium sp. DSM 29163]MCX2724319.1 DUF1150 domain-containing protein [Roseibium sp. DSM 29163]MDN3721634.1 DUF1150 domain-containing protein [Roseibium salinum]